MFSMRIFFQNKVVKTILIWTFHYIFLSFDENDDELRKFVKNQNGIVSITINIHTKCLNWNCRNSNYSFKNPFITRRPIETLQNANKSLKYSIVHSSYCVFMFCVFESVVFHYFFLFSPFSSFLHSNFEWFLCCYRWFEECRCNNHIERIISKKS